MARPSISAFFPAYNDAGSIGDLVRTVDVVLREVTDDYEIIVVNDGSRDATGEVLAGLQAEIPQLRVVTHEVNSGYGGALQSGFRAATKELVFYTDGDGQYDPTELAVLARALESSGADVAQGYKMARRDPMHRVVIGRMYHRVVRAAFGLCVRDVDCDFRLIRRSALDGIELESKSGAICVELVRKVQDGGARFVEVPVHHYPRMHGQSAAFRPRQVAAMLRDLGRLWWRLRR
jgi:glycosyltransferase involved in cell wall biosynthesis